MAHLSLYRKFRPDTFDEIVRQEHVVRILKNQIESGSVGHAYLFCGPRGTGKTSVARILARAVNCASPVDGSPCGKCPTCLALKEGSLDITEIDAASNNGVNEMRDLREKVQYPPVTGKYKVYIIDEVHMLTDSAFNALLKTLEEPPAHAIFILATTEPHKIPATILSRCMRLDFKLIPEEDLERHLTAILDGIGKPYEKEAVAAIARAGAGSDRDMLSIAEMCIAYGDKLTYEGVTAVLGAADFRETASLTDALLRSDPSSVLEQAERILSEGKSVGVLCRDLIEMLGNVTIAKTCRSAEGLLSLPKARFEELAQIASHTDGRAILRAIEILSAAETDLRLVSSPRICLESALLRIALPQADLSTDALLVRVASLEKKLEEGRLPAAPAAPDVSAVPAAPAPQNKVQTAARAEENTVEADCVPIEEPERDRAEVPVPSRAPEETKPAAEAPANRPTEPPVRPEGMTAELAYGKFMRLLRKTSRNGVLFTMCSDLEAAFEGETLVLLTDSETVMRSLSREEHVQIMTDVFRELGIASFAVRMKGAEEKQADGLETLKRDFSDYPIEIK